MPTSASTRAIRRPAACQVGATTPIRIAGCGEDYYVTYRWDDAGPGPHNNLYVVVEPIRAGRESNNANNKLGPVSATASLTALPMNLIAEPASVEPAPGP